MISELKIHCGEFLKTVIVIKKKSGVFATANADIFEIIQCIIHCLNVTYILVY